MDQHWLILAHIDQPLVLCTPAQGQQTESNWKAVIDENWSKWTKIDHISLN